MRTRKVPTAATVEEVIHKLFLVQMSTPRHTLAEESWLTRRQDRYVISLASLDMAAFKISLQAGMPSEPTADQLFHVLRSTLDKHAPVTRRLVSDRPHSPWYNSVGPELLKAKRERRKAEKRWRTSGLTVHRQIFQQTRNKVTDIVHRAKSAFFSSKILSCSTAKQSFSVANNILGKVNTSPLPTEYSVHELPQKFADFFTSRIILIRQNLTLLLFPLFM